jgi:hypothetical protein
MVKISHEDTRTNPERKLRRKVATGLKSSCDIFIYFLSLNFRKFNFLVDSFNNVNVAVYPLWFEDLKFRVE